MATKEQRELAAQRRYRIGDLLLQRVPVSRIASLLGVSEVTVHKHKRELERIWQRELAEDYITLRTRELAELDEMERHCIVKQCQVTSMDLTPEDIEQMGAQKLAAILNDEGNWFDRRLKVKERRAKLLGLDKPELLPVVTSEGNGTTVNNDNRQVIIYVQNPATNDPGPAPMDFVDWMRGSLNAAPEGEVVEGEVTEVSGNE